MEYDIPGYSRLYYAKRNGTIHSYPRKGTAGKQLTPKRDKDGYLEVSLSKDGKTKSHFVHRLIYMTFSDKPLGKLTVHHKNDKRDDNRFANLVSATAQEQQDYIHGKKNKPYKNW